jgi:hypothetical protein
MPVWVPGYATAARRSRGQSDVVRVLLKAGANVNETVQRPAGSKTASSRGALPRAGMGALALAIVNCHFQLAAELLDAGADPNAAKPGWTPLHAITWVRTPGTGSNKPAPPGSGRMTSLEIGKKIAEKGANLNARMTQRLNGITRLNTLDATSFPLAARTDDAELMRFLVGLGADPLLADDDNSTPLIVAAGVGTSSPGEDAGTEIEAMEAVKTALELGNDIDALDNNGETATHRAAYKNLPAVVQYLADRGREFKFWNPKKKERLDAARSKFDRAAESTLVADRLQLRLPRSTVMWDPLVALKPGMSPFVEFRLDMRESLQHTLPNAFTD